MWSRAHTHFEVNLPGLKDASSIAFYAVALDDSGKPLTVMHTDAAFDLFRGAPDQVMLRTHLQTLSRPFPWGLYTPIGILVANRTFAADSTLRALFTPHHYHGEVFWPWQHALIVAGLARQLEGNEATGLNRSSASTT